MDCFCFLFDDLKSNFRENRLKSFFVKIGGLLKFIVITKDLFYRFRYKNKVLFTYVRLEIRK